MSSLTSLLRKPYLIIISVLAALVTCVLLVPANDMMGIEILYYLKSAFFILVLIIVPATSIYISRTNKKHADADEYTRSIAYSKAWKARIYTLGSLVVPSLVLYHLSSDQSFVMLAGAVMILLLLSYPSEGMIERDMQNNSCK